MEYNLFFCLFYLDYVERSRDLACYYTPFAGCKRLYENLKRTFSFHEFLD